MIIGVIRVADHEVLFLRDWGTSLVAGGRIPALAVAFIALRLLGELQPDDAGLAAAVGS